jgi:hypothetical protein
VKRLLNLSHWSFQQCLRDRDQPETHEGVFQKHALSLAEEARQSCPEAARREGRSHLDGRSVFSDSVELFGEPVAC